MGKYIDLTGKTFGEWTVLERVTNTSNKNITWKCRCSCGVEKNVIGQSLKNKTSKSCGHLQRIPNQIRTTHDEFIYKISQTNPHFDDIEILSEYKGCKEKIKCRCKKCGYEYYTSTQALKTHGCRKCADKYIGKALSLSNDEFLYRMSQNERTKSLTFFTEYQNCKTVMKCQCNLCNHTFQIVASDLLQGRGCNNFRYHSDYKNPKMIDLTGKRFGKLTVIKRNTENKNRHVYWNCQCDCGNITTVRSQHLREGIVQSCGCINSKMELKVINELNNRNINYELHKKYDGLIGVGGNPLSYDFYLPNKNILIECQGEQHYKPVEWFGGKEYYTIQQEHDKRKQLYAKNNNIVLIEIPYWESDNIKNIINTVI